MKLLRSALLASLPALVWPQAPLSPMVNDARHAWWTEARFGLFIHWGLYAMAARHEWVKQKEHMTEAHYQRYFERFDPDLYDPKAWARQAKEAGMKYAVLTTKHHEGFCLWDSKFTDYKAPNTHARRDLLKAFVEAFRAEGLKVGFYYSLLDWHHPDYTVDRNHPQYQDAAFRQAAAGRDMAKYRTYAFNQVRELLTEYGRIDCLWLDYSFPLGKDGKGRLDWDSENLLKLVRQLQPQVLVNDRLDLDDQPGSWDFVTPEQFIPREWPVRNGERIPWETCNTFSGSWGYHRDEEGWKSPTQLITSLAEIVSKGGNLLLNVGPTSRGCFDERATERLRALGAWMRLHARSITGCTAAPPHLKAPERCLLTYHPPSQRVYVHVVDWPMGQLFLPGWAGKVKYAQLLHDGSEVLMGRPDAPFQDKLDTSSEGTLILKLPVKKPDVALPVIELHLQ